MIEIIIEGDEDIREALNRIANVISGDWAVPLTRLGELATRYASSISPIVTGSYSLSHRFVLSDKSVEIGINPLARNSVSGALVMDYAGSVEKRHSVYGRTFSEIPRFATVLEKVLLGEMGL